MDKKKMRKQFGKRVVGLLLVVCMFAGTSHQSDAYSVQPGASYMAIQAKSIDLKDNAKVNGFIAEAKREDYSSAVYYLAGSNCTISDFVSAAGNYSVESPTYCRKNVNLKVDNYNGENIFAADKNIRIACSSFYSPESTIIYSKTGNIAIDCDNFDFKGIICAPDGNVSIKGKNVKLSGSIIGKNVTVKADTTEITPTKESNQLYVFLESYRNEGYMLFDAYVDEGNLNVYCEPNLEMDRGIVYIRNKGEKKFSELGEFKTNEGKIEGFDFAEQVDIIVQGKTVFDEDILSDVITLAKDETGEVYCEKLDSDNDGIADGIEIYYLKSDPYAADTDKDGIPDGAEVFHLFTDPTVPDKLENDFDRDGVTNIEEVRKGTDPYLRDTDFDGKKDKEDSKPGKYEKKSRANYIPTTSAGKFDRIVTTINEDGSCTQKLYDFINEKVRIESNGDCVTSYHYNYDLKLATKITSYKGQVNSNHYEYDGRKMTAVYNNGYKYGFIYDDNKALTEVTLNDVGLISYSSSGDDSSLQYANGDWQTFSRLGNQWIVKTADGSNYTYTYDEAGKIARYDYEDSGISVSYAYDENDVITKVETNGDFSIEYNTTELEKGRENTIAYTIGEAVFLQNNKTTYMENGSRVLSSTLMNGENVTRYFESDNTIIEKLKVNEENYFKRITYGANSMPERIRHSDGIAEEYEYDSRENVTRVRENDSLTRKYEYDDRNRLVSCADLVKGTISLYEYDLCDNIKSVGTYTYSDGEKGYLTAMDIYEYQEAYKDQLVKFNGSEITYDENGKPLVYYDGSVFAWDGDRLRGAVQGEKEISFMHDAGGTVIKKTVNGIDTVYCVEGKDYIAETTDGKTIMYMYDGDANLIGFTYEGNAYYYIKNAFNDVIRIVDSRNQFVCGYTYDAYGELLSISGDEDIANLNKYRYRSYYFDTDMGLYYLHSRYYDSQTRRFISTDQAEMTLYAEDNLNLYAYCKGNPVYYSDPEGTAVRVAVITLNCWKNESGHILYDLQQYYGPSNVLGKQYNMSNMNEVESTWNSMSNCSVVVINTHGSPTVLTNNIGNDDSTDLTLSEISSLEYKAVRTLILLGCNAGHQDERWHNVAYEFSKRISGKVVASDGTVYSALYNFYYPVPATFYSRNNGHFSEYCSSARDNRGWVIYSYRSFDKRKCTLTNMKSMTIKSIMDYLKSMSSSNSYKQ